MQNILAAFILAAALIQPAIGFDEAHIATQNSAIGKSATRNDATAMRATGADTAAAVAADAPVVLTAVSEVWIGFDDAEGKTVHWHTLDAGEVYEIPPDYIGQFTMRTSIPQALNVTVGGRDIGPVGPADTLVKGISLKPADLVVRADNNRANRRAAVSKVASAAVAECKPQPMLSAIESAGLPPSERPNNVITFSATPSLEYPGRAWVIRLLQPVSGQPATLTVVRLRLRDDCNVYDVETRWEAPFRVDEYETIATLVTPHIRPPPDILTPEDTGEITIIFDGTSFDLRVENERWKIKRILHNSEPDGVAISRIFHRLLAPVVPAPERPGDSWSMTGR